MIVVDTSFLLDYLDGVRATATYLSANEDRPFFAPSLVLFEVYRGAVRTGGREALDRVATALEWLEPLPVDEPAAAESALIEAELLDAGERVNLADTLIAGVCRHHGARILTRDGHFDRIQGLVTETY